MLEKTETVFNIRLNYHRKDVSSPKSILADLHFRKLDIPSIYMQNLHESNN